MDCIPAYDKQGYAHPLPDTIDTVYGSRGAYGYRDYSSTLVYDSCVSDICFPYVYVLATIIYK